MTPHKEIVDSLTIEQVLDVLVEYDSTQPSAAPIITKVEGQEDTYTTEGEFFNGLYLRNILENIMEDGEYSEHFKSRNEPEPHLKYLIKKA